MPGILCHFIERAGDTPVELFIRFGGIGPVSREVAITAGSEVILHRLAAGFTESIHHIQHAAANPGAEVVNMHARFVRQLLHRRHVAVGQIHDVNVIAHAGAIFGGIIVTKNRQGIATPYGNLRDIRHQVVRNALRIFAHIT